MNLSETKSSLKRKVGKVSTNDKYHFDLLMDAYDDYFNNKDLIATCDGDSAIMRIAVKQKQEAKETILKLLKLFGIAPDDRTEVKEETSALEDLL